MLTILLSNMSLNARSPSPCVGHIVWVTLCGSHCVGHIVWVTLCRSHCVGHIAWVTLCGSHCVGHCVRYCVKCAIFDSLCQLCHLAQRSKSKVSDLSIGSSTVMLMAVPLAKRMKMDSIADRK